MALARRGKKKTTAGGFVAIAIVLTLLTVAGYYMIKSAKESAPKLIVRSP